MKKIDIIDYKGKYWHYQDPDRFDDSWDYKIGETTKEKILSQGKEEIQNHKENCRYFGIPTYIGKDKGLEELFKMEDDK